MENIASQFVKFLASQSVGTVGSSLFVGQIPDVREASDTALVANSSGGGVSYQTTLENVMLTCVLRSSTYQGAQTMFDSIVTAVNSTCNTELVAGGNELVLKMIDSPLTYVGIDESNRYLFEFSVSLSYVR